MTIFIFHSYTQLHVQNSEPSFPHLSERRKSSKSSMKLRLRRAGTSDTRRVQVPNDCTLAWVCETAAREFNVPVDLVYLSLNQRDSLGQSGDELLRSLGVCGGDMLYVHLAERLAHEGQWGKGLISVLLFLAVSCGEISCQEETENHIKLITVKMSF